MLHKKCITVSLLLLIAFILPFRLCAQVNLQTGSAVFSLPIFDWKDNQSRLNGTVSLSYNSGNGLRVDDLASNVGQGWNLVAGGVISRMQVGEPDDQPAYGGTPAYGNGIDQDKTKYPAGYLYAPYPAAQGCPSALTRYPIYGSKNQVYTQRNDVAEDRQLDYFSFQFNGKTGLFILNTNNGDYGQSLGDSKMIITFQRDNTMTSQGIRTTITAFTIQDVDGLIYKFTLHGLTKVLESSFTDSKVTRPQTQPTFGEGGIYHQAGFDLGPTSTPWVNSEMANPWVINNWYLTEIDEPLTGRKITFTYNQLSLTNSAGADINYNSSSKHYVVISHKTSVSVTQELSTITFQDGHKVALNYSPTQRADFAGEYPLSSIDITYQPRPTDPIRFLSEYQLKTSYFILNRYGTPTSDYEKSAARLCLLSVKKIGVDLKEDAPPYIFDYYTGGDGDNFIPPPFFYAKDVWGYYNGSNSVKSDNSAGVPLVNTTLAQLDFPSLKGLCFQNDAVSGVYLNPKSGYAQNGLLRQIIYPTGGTLSYTYAQNTGVIPGISGTSTVGGVHVAQTSSTDGGYSNGCANPMVTSYNYVLSDESSSSLWGLEMPVNSLSNNNYFAWEHETLHWSLSCPTSCCKWHYLYPGILSQDEAMDLNTMQKVMNALAPVLGVLTVISDVMDVINVCLDATPLAIVAVALDVITGVITLIIGCKQYTQTTNDVIYYNFDLNSGAPTPAQFKRVEIVENPGTIGKTVQEFTSSDDYPIWYPTNPVLSPKQRFAPWAYGLSKRTAIYDNQNRLIHEIVNHYDTTNAMLPILGPWTGGHEEPAPITSTKCQVVLSSSERNDNWSSQSQYDDPSSFITTSNAGVMNVDMYAMYTGHMELDSVYDRTFRPSNQALLTQKETKYTYDISNYQVQSITTTKSNGDKSSKFFRYSTEGDNTGLLVDNNILNEPTEEGEIVVPVGSELYDYPIDDFNYYLYVYGPGLYKVLSDHQTTYTQLPNGDVRPALVQEERFAAPVDGTQGGIAGYGPAVYHPIQTMSYDANSNLAGIKDEGGRTVTNLYDYNDKYITAVIANCDPAVDHPAVTSFEWNDLSRSGWTLTGPAMFNQNVPSPTGTANFKMMAGSGNQLIVTTLNTARAYICSFWASSSGMTVSGSATLTKTGPTYNGWTYYEYSIGRGASAVYVLNQTAAPINIDELRLYPATARVSSTTYDPLIGKTSVCDENNRITYYEYDNLGRLRFVKDENRNIVKMYEYNNVSAAKQQGCPGNFSNHLITETWTKTDCAAGYQGGTATYTVPAAKYTSTLSQWDADIKAEMDALLHGPQTAEGAACNFIYWNDALSSTDSCMACPAGKKGGIVTYTVPAHTYWSVISKADANAQAAADTAANAQAFANSYLSTLNACVADNAPDWESEPGSPTRCQAVPPDTQEHLQEQATDENPGSPTYNQTTWEDEGPSSSCPIATEPIIVSNYTGTSMVLSLKNNSTNITYTYTVNPNTINATVANLPLGTSYIITMSPTSYTVNSPIVYTINVPGVETASQTYYAAVSFGGVPFTNTVQLTMAPPPYYQVYMTNTTNNLAEVTFQEQNTGAKYIFPSTAHTNNLDIGQVPQGLYTVTITPTNYSSSVPLTSTITVPGVVSASQNYYAAVSYGNINMTNTCTITLVPTP